MAPDAETLLTALQFADSAFPSGSFAFSWGLEGLAADGFADGAADVAAITEEQLRHRWNTMDRLLLRRSHGAASVAERAAIDRDAETATLSAPMRTGSRRAGRALLGMSARLGHEQARSYREATHADARLGHLAVVQGIVFEAAGLPLPLAEMLSGWSVVNGLASAAMRLGMIGHVEAQTMAVSLRPILAELLAATPRETARLSAFTPLAEIAVNFAALMVPMLGFWSVTMWMTSIPDLPWLIRSHANLAA